MANIIVAFESGTATTARLRALVGQLGYAVPLLSSVWYLKTPLSTDEVRDRLSSSFDYSDRVLVVDADSATGWNIDAQNWNRLRDQWSK